MAKGSNTVETGYRATRQVHTENVSVSPQRVDKFRGSSWKDFYRTGGVGRERRYHLNDESQNVSRYFVGVVQL